MSERKHADLWRELVDEAGEDAIDRAANVSVAQAEAELEAAGFDVAAERAKAGAFVDALGGGVSSSTSRAASSSPSREAAPRGAERTRRTRLRPAVAWLAAAATLAVAGGALYVTLHPFREIVTSPPPPKPSRPAPVVPSADDLAVAAELRRKAAGACEAKQWSACLAELDEARGIDPEGDAALAAKSLRDKAISGNRDGR